MNVEVAVIGGGPAGCAAALTLRARGHSVTVIDAGRRVEKPTETAVPQLKRLLLDIGAKGSLSACEPCYGIASRWGEGGFAPSMMNPSGHAWFVHRAHFDRALQTAAQDAGARWIETKATDIAFEPSGVSIALAGGTTINAQWVVLTTGSPSWPAVVTRQTPLTVDTLIAFWSELSARLQERLLFVEASEHGWWYVCPGAGGGAVACFVTDAMSARPLKASQADGWNALFNATALSRRLTGKASAIRVRAAPTGALPRTAGRGWIAAGDAAVRLDPLGSSGTFMALDGGRRAALAVSAALRGNFAAADGYSRWTAGLLAAFTRQRRQHYAIEAKLQTGAFWTARLRAAA